MEYKIAMLLKPHMCAYCENNFGDEFGGIPLTYFPYSTLDEMGGIFTQIKARFDGVVTSGLIPHNLVLSLLHQDEISAAYFGFDIENTYRIILEQSVCRKDFNLSRIGVDFIPAEEDVARVIAENRLPSLVSKFEKWLLSIPPKRLAEEEAGIAQRYLERYRRGEIDFIVTYFHSTTLEMARHGIDCFYLYPNSNEIQHTFDGLIKSIRLRRAALPAIVRIDLRPGQDTGDSTAEELRMATLKKTVLELLAGDWNDIVMKSDHRSLELCTDSHVLSRLTDGFSRCFFSAPLYERMGFRGTLGYGISSNLYHARLGAVDASSYASHFRDAKPHSYLIGMDEKLVHLPFGHAAEHSAQIASPEWVRGVAEQVHLSPETIMRILSVLQEEKTDRISSTELIGRLGVSLRTANRFLANLHSNGMAELVGYRHAAGKGRPIAVYRILLEEKPKAAQPLALTQFR